jgi:transcriptional regulator with XRE-family HTH domain
MVIGSLSFGLDVTSNKPRKVLAFANHPAPSHGLTHQNLWYFCLCCNSITNFSGNAVVCCSTITTEKEAAMTFGEYFKTRRLSLGITLREFCEKFGFDPGNISKLERGLFAAPQSDEKLREYANALRIKLDSEDFIQLTDLAAVSNRTFKPRQISDQDVLQKLPILFRTLDNKELTEEKLTRIIEIIKEEEK